MDDDDLRVVLLGMMGSGKTTVGRAIQALTGWRYVDNDELLHEATGSTLSELGDRLGPDGLHALEVQQIQRAVAMPGPLVAGAAGAIIEEEPARIALREAFSVYLRARVETLAERVGTGENRVWLREDPAGALRRLLEPRAALYEQCADLIIDVDELPPEEIARQIVEAVKKSRAG